MSKKRVDEQGKKKGKKKTVTDVEENDGPAVGSNKFFFSFWLEEIN